MHDGSPQAMCLSPIWRQMALSLSQRCTMISALAGCKFTNGAGGWVIREADAAALFAVNPASTEPNAIGDTVVEEVADA
jgi:hypothetical protein